MGSRAESGPALPAWAALLWLDWRLLRNRARIVARNPRRLVPWLLFLVLLAPNLVNRVLFASAARRSDGLPVAAIMAPAGRFVPGAALVVLGLALWQAGGRPPAAFQSPADGRFLVGSGMPARLVLAWLALRSARRLLMAGLFYLVLLGLSIPSSGLSSIQLLAATAGLTVYLWLIFGARVVLFAAQTRTPGTSLGWVGTAVVGVGLVTLGATAAGIGPAGPLNALPPGSWLQESLQGRLGSVGLLAALALALAAAGTAAAGDCLPELWLASSRGFELRRQVRHGGLIGLLVAGARRGRGDRPVTAASLPGVWAPPGAWALAWKEWLTTLRVRGGLQLQTALLLGAVVGGTVAGVLTVGQPLVVGLILAYALFLFSVVTNLLAVRLAADLRSPVWWLAVDPIWRRLAVLTLARAARLGVPLALFGTVLAALASGLPGLAIGFALVALALAWMLSALGLASYTVLPAASDVRVAQTVRVFAFYAALVPVGVAAVPGTVAGSVPLVLAGAALALTAETVAFIAFAAHRLRGNGLAFAREERQ